MTDIGLMSYYLGLEVKQMEEGHFISQESYIKEIFEEVQHVLLQPCEHPNEKWNKIIKV